jgi:aldehyde:ferredoxin oxidoreductase
MSSPVQGALVQSAARTEVQGIGPQGYPVQWHTRSGFGGRFSDQLKYAGWDGVVIEGAASEPVWVNIVNDQVTFEDASELWGLNTMETQEEIWRLVTDNARFGEWLAMGDDYTTQRPAVLCIGQAGEHLSTHACLIHDLRGAGQGGFGAVFGSKNLKAVSVIGTGSVTVADPQALFDTWLWYMANFNYDVNNPRRETPDTTYLGYGRMVRAPGRGIGYAIEPARPQGCQACGYACGRRLQSGIANEATCSEAGLRGMASDANGGRAMGKGTDICQHYGLNGWGGMQASYLRNLYKEGVLGPGKQIESDLPWDKYGKLEFWEAFCRQIAYREGIGEDMALGTARAAKKWGRYEQDTDSGLLNLTFWGYGQHYEPRVEVEWSYGSILGDRDINEHGINYEVYWMPVTTAAVGEDPLVTAEDLVNILASKAIPYTGDPFMWDYSEGPTGIYSEHRAKEIAWHRHYSRSWKQSVLYCDWVWPEFVTSNAPDLRGPTPEGEIRFWNAVTGKNQTFADVMEIGRKIWNLDKAIWVMQGRHRNMEVLAGYVHTTPRTSSWPGPVYENGAWKYGTKENRILDRTKFEEFKTRFFEFEGWDTTSGWPTRATLEGLDLGYVADDLQADGKLGI